MNCYPLFYVREWNVRFLFLFYLLLIIECLLISLLRGTFHRPVPYLKASRPTPDVSGGLIKLEIRLITVNMHRRVDACCGIILRPFPITQNGKTLILKSFRQKNSFRGA